MRYVVMNTPLGELTLASTERGLASIDLGRRIPPGGVVDVESNRVFIKQIEEQFQGPRTHFDFALNVAYGQTRTYGEIAIVVPCHRVVEHDGSLTGYAGGLRIKQQLLTIETRTLSV